MASIIAPRRATIRSPGPDTNPDPPNITKVNTPCLKIVIRLLPPLLSEQQFWEQAQSYSPSLNKQEIEWYFCKGLNSDKAYEPPVYSRCYILFKTIAEKDSFIQDVKGKPFFELNTNDLVVPMIMNAPFFNDMPSNWNPTKSTSGLKNKEVFIEFTKYLNGEISSFGLSKKQPINDKNHSKQSGKKTESSEHSSKKKKRSRRNRKSLKKGKEVVENVQRHDEPQELGGLERRGKNGHGKNHLSGQNQGKNQLSGQTIEAETTTTTTKSRKKKRNKKKRDKEEEVHLEKKDNRDYKDNKDNKDNEGEAKNSKESKSKSKSKKSAVKAKAGFKSGETTTKDIQHQNGAVKKQPRNDNQGKSHGTKDKDKNEENRHTKNVVDGKEKTVNHFERNDNATVSAEKTEPKKRSRNRRRGGKEAK